MLLATILCCQVLHSLWTAFCPSFEKDFFLDLHGMYLFLGIIVECHICILLMFWPCYTGCGICCSMSICFLAELAFLVVYIPLQLMARMLPRFSLYIKRTVFFFVSREYFCCEHNFLGSGCTLLWILPPQRMVSWYTWNGIYFCLNAPDDISASLVWGLCHGPCHQHILSIFLLNMSPAGT